MNPAFCELIVELKNEILGLSTVHKTFGTNLRIHPLLLCRMYGLLLQTNGNWKYVHLLGENRDNVLCVYSETNCVKKILSAGTLKESGESIGLFTSMQGARERKKKRKREEREGKGEELLQELRRQAPDHFQWQHVDVSFVSTHAHIQSDMGMRPPPHPHPHTSPLVMSCHCLQLCHRHTESVSRINRLWLFITKHHLKTIEKKLKKRTVHFTC